MGKSFRPNAARTGAASAAPVVAAAPALTRSAPNNPKRRVDAPALRVAGDALTERIGDPIFRQSAVFPWCTNHAGLRDSFARHYLNVKVLVDVFATNNEAAHAEMRRKADAIAAHNAANPHDRLGYLALLTGRLPSPFDVDLAKMGDAVLLKPKA